MANAMRIDVAALRQQAWRPDKLYSDFIRYAKSIDCTFAEDHDKFMCTEDQACKVAQWWREHTS
jgi:hypothetical protein